MNPNPYWLSNSQSWEHTLLLYWVLAYSGANSATAIVVCFAGTPLHYAKCIVFRRLYPYSGMSASVSNQEGYEQQGPKEPPNNNKRSPLVVRRFLECLTA